MKLLQIFTLILFLTCCFGAAVMILVACGGSKRKYEKFTSAELEKLEEFRAEQREPPKP